MTANDVQAHIASILLREVGTAINRILESGEAASRVKALVAAGEHSELAGTQARDDYAMFAEPFRRFGARYATRGYTYKSILQEVEAINAKLLGRFAPSWTRITGDSDLLDDMLALPVREALLEAQKIIVESTEVHPSDAKEHKEPTIAESVPVPEAVSSKLEQIRIECNLTYEELADKTGKLDDKAVSEHCNGKRGMQLKTAHLYKQVFERLGKTVEVTDIYRKKLPKKTPA